KASPEVTRCPTPPGGAGFQPAAGSGRLETCPTRGAPTRLPPHGTPAYHGGGLTPREGAHARRPGSPGPPGAGPGFAGPAAGRRPVHSVRAGEAGEVALEDALLAGAVVDSLWEAGPARLNDGARLAWDCFEHHGRVLYGALTVAAGGARLRALGYDEDIRAAA